MLNLNFNIKSQASTWFIHNKSKVLVHFCSGHVTSFIQPETISGFNTDSLGNTFSPPTEHTEYEKMCTAPLRDYRRLSLAVISVYFFSLPLTLAFSPLFSHLPSD